MLLTNTAVLEHDFLPGMYAGSYFPKAQVDKVKNVLLSLCAAIEQDRPASVEQFLKLTHAATEAINDLADEFYENGSELETVAREVMADDFAFIAKAYGFGQVDIEEIIAPREW